MKSLLTVCCVYMYLWMCVCVCVHSTDLNCPSDKAKELTEVMI